jgi:DNA-binding MarR family transcriptional regulator
MENLLIEFINTLDSSLKKVQKQVGDGSGVSKLTINQFHYIDAIYSLGEPTITEIADRLNITKASVTTGINKLVNMGYVIKTQSNEDKRVFHVTLTEASGQLIKAKYQALKEYGEFIGAALSEDEARQFEVILTKLVKLFEQA